MKAMSFLHKFLIIAPAACLLAQTPPAPTPAPAAPPATAPAAPKLATPIPPGVIAPPPAPPKPVEVPPDRVVLKAGSVTLTRAQFDEIIDGLPDRFHAMYHGPGRKQWADTLVQLYILSDEARRRKLDETSPYKIQAKLSADSVLASMIRDQVVAEIKVADEADARKFYDEHIADKYEEVTARHILIRAKGSQIPVKAGAKELSDEEALAKANDIRKRILAGEDFATLAKAESDDATNANDGGLLKPFTRKLMQPSFEQAAFSLKPGELSQPVKTTYGYHIIKVETHVTKSFEEVRPQIEKMPQLVQAKQKKALDEMTKGAFYDPEFFGPPATPPQGSFVPMVRPANPPPAPPANPQAPPAPAKP